MQGKPLEYRLQELMNRMRNTKPAEEDDHRWKKPLKQRAVSTDIAVWSVEITVRYDDLMCIIMIQYDISCFHQIHDAFCIYLSFSPMQAFILVNVEGFTQ